ncbi:MAG: AAA family ATPase [Saprospiraceae bacterium]|nr:AAA family ATPase [Saprospiraceae bacterium]
MLAAPFFIEEISLVNIVNTLWVKPIASHILDSNFLCITFIFITSVYFFYYSSGRISRLIIFIQIYSIILIALTKSHFVYTNFYWTIPFLLILIYSIINLWKQFKLNQIKEFDINNINDDFKRNNFAKSIIENIINSQEKEHSFNYGIIGEWGSGKTYLLKLIKKHAKIYINENQNKTEHAKNNIIIFEYLPWETPLTKNFSLQILDALKNNIASTELKILLNRYIQKIDSDTDKILIKSYTFIFDWLINDNRTESDLKFEIGNILKNENKKVVILIDDLDRLYESEIKELFRLFRNTFDIPNLFFIVGFDYQYVLRTLQMSRENFDNYISNFSK